MFHQSVFFLPVFDSTVALDQFPDQEPEPREINGIDNCLVLQILTRCYHVIF